MVVVGTTLSNMPELPEVETVKNTLIKRENIIGKIIESIIVIRAKNLLNKEDIFVSSLIGAKITNLTRIGKFLIFHFDNSKVMVSHLRMEGKFFMKNKEDPIAKHDIVVFNFADNKSLHYNDTRKFGILGVFDEDKYMNQEPIKNVGPDPFMIKDVDRLIKAYEGKKIPIKTMLLDQSVMAGLGNIYCDEVLYETKIHPETLAKDITPNQCEEILKASINVLTKAIAQGGSTIHSYQSSEGINGEFQVNLKAYGKENEPCLRCKTPLLKINVGGRGTTYCPNCQKNKSLPFIIGVTGPVGVGKSLVTSLLNENKYEVFDADEIVHQLYNDKQYALDFTKNLHINGILKDEVIDRSLLRTYLLNNKAKKEKVNQYVWQSVKDKIIGDLKRMDKKDVAILDVPLLFESKLNYICDTIILVWANEETQKKHLLKRKASLDLFKINDGYHLEEKKEKANYIVNNDGSLNELKKRIKQIKQELKI